MIDKPLLANELISALSNPTRGIARYISGKYATAMSKNIQVDIVQAQKFLLSDNLLNHTVRASHVEPKYLLEGLRNARPPFNNMWVEWNEKERVTKNRKEMIKLLKEKGETAEVEPLDLEAIPDRVGYHIKRLDEEFTSTEVLYTCFFQMEDKRFYCSEMGFSINYNCDYSFENFQKSWESQNNKASDCSEERFYTDASLNGAKMLGLGYTSLFMDGTTKEDIYLKEIFTNLIPVQTCATHWTRSAESFLSPVQQEDIERHRADLESLSGDPRFLIALLNMLNYDLISTETVIPPKEITHLYLSRSVPKNEYKIVEINLPKPRGKRVYNRMFTGQGAPKREHWRRGHWRRVHDKRGKLIKRVWIGEQKVGDKKLGKIIHDYELVKKQQ